MHRRKGRGVRIIQTFRMAEPAGALANFPRPVWRLTSAARAVRVRSDVEDDIVRVGRVRNALDSIEGVEAESIPREIASRYEELADRAVDVLVLPKKQLHSP